MIWIWKSMNLRTKEIANFIKTTKFHAHEFTRIHSNSWPKDPILPIFESN